MKKLTGLLFVIVLAGSSCKKALDVNQNPNQPTAVTPNVVLSAALVGTASNNAFDFPGVSRWMGYFSRSGNYVPDVQTETYTIPNDYTDGEWSNIYLNLNSYDYIEKTGQSLDLPFYVGVAKVMKAYNFGILVDMYNDVPYKEAFQISAIIKPKYDKGEDIYVDLVHQCDSAIQYFEKAKVFYAAQPSSVGSTDDQYDVMFGSGKSGAVSQDDRLVLWEKFTNTLKLKLLLTMSNVATQQGLITTEIDAINTNGFGFLGVGESATVNPGYTASNGKISPVFALFRKLDGTPTNADAYYRANTYAVNFYVGTEDERQYVVYSGVSGNPGSNYDGDPASVPNANTAGVGPGLVKDFTQVAVILSDFESLFLQAEAVQRGWNVTGNAKNLYESAVEQNYVYLASGKTASGIITTPVPDAQSYLSLGHDLADWSASPDKLATIMTQKWIALNGISWVTAYSDYRRTHFPGPAILGISHSSDHVQPQIPTRFLYPQSEFNTNGSNVPSLGANGQFTTVFWNQ